MRVDSHHHFWTLARGDYGWLSPDLGPLYRDYTPAELRPLLHAAGVDRTVAVQAAPTVAETRHLLRIARTDERVAAVVGWVDMDRPTTALAALRRLARDPRFRGVRPMIQDIDDAAWMLGPGPAAVFEALIDGGLRFDALVRSEHLPALRALLCRYPELQAVVDHGAKPDIARRCWQPWADRIAAIGAETRAHCKLSGLLTEAREGDGLTRLAPYLDHLYHCFGPDRLMWGSDWPVLNGAAAFRNPPPEHPYDHWHGMMLRWLRDKTDAERAAIEGDNAARFYGLPTRTRDG